MPSRPPLTAKTADRHDLYQRSVQAVDHDARFLSRWYLRTTGEPLRRLREDFCGTAGLSCAFVALHADNHALGVDLHAPTLAWGRKHNVARLDADARRRLKLVRGDVLAVRAPRMQMTIAANFSYCVFKQRDVLRAWIRNARRGLLPGGYLMLDAWGGSETQVEQEERRRCDGFTYVWDQHSFDPLTYHTVCKIHFEFRDGTRMRDAFVYDWRLWTVPELRECMEAEGFEDVHVLWEQTDRATNTGNGIYRRVAKGTADMAWLVYVVGRAPRR